MYKIAKYASIALGVLGILLWIWLSVLYTPAGTPVEEVKNNFWNLWGAVSFQGLLSFTLYFTYFIVAIVLVSVIVSASISIASSPKALKKTLIYTGAFVLVLLVAYIFSSGSVEANASEEVKKASESVRKWVSTGLIALYLLVAVAVVALVASNVKKALMK
nr:hypothetical protein [uncultured Capnocytophaga sp.]